MFQLSQITNKPNSTCDLAWKKGDFSGFNNVTYTIDQLDACANYSVRVFGVNQAGDPGVVSETSVTMPTAGKRRLCHLMSTAGVFQKIISAVHLF